jgi:hypothetical protein
MSSLNTYWLCRAPGASTEGPFSISQLRKMHEAGTVTADSVVCREGEQAWLMLDSELEALEVQGAPMPGKPVAQPPRQPQEMSFAQAMYARDQEQANGYNTAINWITGAICLTGFIPLLGLLAFVIWGGWALIATVLCVLQMSKGQTGRGIQNLIGVWILAPVIIAGLQFVGVTFFGAMAQP